MAIVGGSLARMRAARGVVRGVAAAASASAALFACINFDGLDSAGPDGGPLPTPDSSVPDTAPSGPVCEAGVQTDPFNCGGCGHICPLRVNSIPACSLGVCGISCNTQFGNCDKVDENGCEAQLFADPKNCGACGRDCAGGACTNGSCQPVTLASGQSYPQTLAVDQSTVYWASLYSYSVDKVAKDGGPFTSLSQGEIYPSGVALDAKNLYWVDRGYGTGDGLVRKLSLTGGAPTTLVGDLSTHPTAITVTGGAGAEIYYATLGTNGLDGEVWRVSPDNVPDSGAGAVVATLQNNPTSLVADATGVYWTNYGSAVPPDAGQNGSVMRCAVPECPGGPEAVATGQAHPRGIALDATHVYFTEYGTGQGDGSVVRVPRASTGGLDGGGAAVTTLAGGLLYPDAVAVDAKYVYFTTRAGLIQRVPLAGGAPETVATLVQSYATAIATDERFLYFATPGGAAGGTIQKLLK